MKITKTTPLAILFTGLLFVTGCQEEESSVSNTITTTSQKNQDKRFVSSWLDTSDAQLHFTLFKDGTAKSDNMTTLLYKKWRIEGDKIIFTIKSIGNGGSSTDEETYEIVKIDDKELILKQESYQSKYLKK